MKKKPAALSQNFGAATLYLDDIAELFSLFEHAASEVPAEPPQWVQQIVALTANDPLPILEMRDPMIDFLDEEQRKLREEADNARIAESLREREQAKLENAKSAEAQMTAWREGEKALRRPTLQNQAANFDGVEDLRSAGPRIEELVLTLGDPQMTVSIGPGGVHFTAAQESFHTKGVARDVEAIVARRRPIRWYLIGTSARVWLTLGTPFVGLTVGYVWLDALMQRASVGKRAIATLLVTLVALGLFAIVVKYVPPKRTMAEVLPLFLKEKPRVLAQINRPQVVASVIQGVLIAVVLAIIFGLWAKLGPMLGL